MNFLVGQVGVFFLEEVDEVLLAGLAESHSIKEEGPRQIVEAMFVSRIGNRRDDSFESIRRDLSVGLEDPIWFEPTCGMSGVLCGASK